MAARSSALPNRRCATARDAAADTANRRQTASSAPLADQRGEVGHQRASLKRWPKHAHETPLRIDDHGRAAVINLDLAVGARGSAVDQTQRAGQSGEFLVAAGGRDEITAEKIDILTQVL